MLYTFDICLCQATTIQLRDNACSLSSCTSIISVIQKIKQLDCTFFTVSTTESVNSYLRNYGNNGGNCRNFRLGHKYLMSRGLTPITCHLKEGASGAPVSIASPSLSSYHYTYIPLYSNQILCKFF